MRTIPTSAQLLDGFRRAADAAIAGRISPTSGAQVRLSWAPTSFFNVVRVGAVRLAQRCLWVIDDRFRASFLDTAVGDDLDAAWARVQEVLEGRYKRGGTVEGWDGHAAERVARVLIDAWR